MTRCLMMGKYSPESIKDISPNRTEKAVNLIKELGGKVNSMYALLGGFDLLFIADFPKLETAMKASLALTMLTGISFSTYPTITVEEFDKLASKL